MQSSSLQKRRKERVRLHREDLGINASQVCGSYRENTDVGADVPHNAARRYESSCNAHQLRRMWTPYGPDVLERGVG